MKRALDVLTLALATCGFMTYPLVRWAKSHRWRWTGSGLIGTAAGVISARLLPEDLLRCAIVLLGVWFVSIAISDRAEELLGTKDDQRIVIDEWAGYLTSIAFLPRKPLYLILAFILFRVVDAGKPLGIRRLGDLSGGLGVVADDLAGGILVNFCLQAVHFFL